MLRNVNITKTDDTDDTDDMLTELGDMELFDVSSIYKDIDTNNTKKIKEMISNIDKYKESLDKKKEEENKKNNYDEDCEIIININNIINDLINKKNYLESELKSIEMSKDL